MRRAQPVLLAALALTALCLARGAHARDGERNTDAHRFGVIGHSFATPGDAHFRKALAETSDKSLAFVVITGIKAKAEPCGDRLYQERRALVDKAKRPIVVLPAGSDWTDCRNSAGRTSAVERLNRLRELFHGEPHTLGAKGLALTRLSMSPRFRSYAENAHWSVGSVLYATVNLPANNNHYLAAAGRNSEYEDRMVATRFWLNRLFTLARRDRLDAVVLFAEGDLKPLAEPTGLRGLLRRTPGTFDGFAAVRKQVRSLAQKFKGKVLLVDSAAVHAKAQPAIEWRGNIGHLSIDGEAVEVEVRPGQKELFSLQDAGK